MKYVKLGSSSLEVSRVCLGSMTWGVQNTQADANLQLDYAQTQGVNFIDTAEMYPTPPSKKTYGQTERIIGNWLKANPSRRKEIILASKIAGPGLTYIRNGSPISRETVTQAVDASLQRLQTEHIDLYQLHWPNYTSSHFGKHWPNQVNFTQMNAQENKEVMYEILQGLADCVKAGKISYCGLSDDSPWGINQYIRMSEEFNLPRIVSIQNEFSLLHTKDWPYLIENCVHEDIAYLPWSPLATGLLTGKYSQGARPKGSRWSIIQRHGLFRDTPQSVKAADAFVSLAKRHNISPVTLALGWIDQVNGVTSTIIGATSVEQLAENIDAFNKPLSQEVLAEVEVLLKEYAFPF